MIKTVKLVDLCVKITDGTHHTPNYINDGIPFLRVTDVTGSNESKKYISREEHLELIKRCRPENGDVLYTKNGTIGVAKKVTWDYEFSIFVSLCLLKIKSDIVDTDYLVHYLNTEYALRQALAHSKKATISNLHLVEIKKIKIPLPPIPQQKKIAAILDAADVYRQQTKALIGKYEELGQSLFLEMFGDPVGNNKNLPKIKLGKLGKWMSGGTPSRKNLEYYLGEIPWLSSGELEKMFISESKEYITELAVKESNAKIIEAGSLLLGMYDTAALKSAITTVQLSCNQAIAYCRLNDDLVNTIYVYVIIQIAKEHYRRLQRGVRQKNLNLT